MEQIKQYGCCQVTLAPNPEDWGLEDWKVQAGEYEPYISQIVLF